MANSKAAFALTSQSLAILAATLTLAAGLAPTPVAAQRFPITPAQRSTAEQVAAAGIALSELAPNAPDNYTVKAGDTLWSISSLFLKSPWRWPELWGMNIEQLDDPHLIYPGQELFLEKGDGLARLRVGRPAGDQAPTETVRLSPRTRVAGLRDTSIPTLKAHLIEPFLAEPLIVGEGELDRAPRIVAGTEERVLLTRGDRAYARGRTGTPFLQRDPKFVDLYRVFRNATPLKDPHTREILGYEAQYLGQAELVRSESSTQTAAASDSSAQQPVAAVSSKVVPATLDIIHAKEEMRVGDRLLPEPPRQMVNFVPRAPEGVVNGSIVSVYGNAVVMAGQNQIVVINKGTADGIQSGHVLRILKDGREFEDRSQADDRAQVKLPNERNGLMMVFRPFERVSYALVLEINDPVRVGDRVTNPR